MTSQEIVDNFLQSVDGLQECSAEKPCPCCKNLSFIRAFMNTPAVLELGIIDPYKMLSLIFEFGRIYGQCSMLEEMEKKC